jgi:lipopolysaccharide transport system ATP-binding protein
MSEVAISIEDLSKIYKLGQIGTGSISHDLNRFIARVLNREDPSSIIGSNNKIAKNKNSYVKVLENISFNVNKGQVFGIIGKNGAGKSTLLKIISQITKPTNGRVKYKGKIASLLEVGTGMHPEMTAKENIYLNGSILGMQKSEIEKQFDNIIDFSGCSLFVDTPVKRFSSGMRVRLGFAVAAFLNPDILIIDEVLAVGDYEFQKNAIGKIKDVSKNEGRTVLFVSHNMGSIKNICDSGIVLSNGEIGYESSNISDLVRFYQNQSISKISKLSMSNRSGLGNIKFLNLKLFNKDGLETNQFYSGDLLKFKFIINNNLTENTDVQVAIRIRSSDESYDSMLGNEFLNKKMNLKKGQNKINCELFKIPFSSGKFIVNIILKKQQIIEDFIQDIMFFEVVGGGYLIESYTYPESYRGIYIDHNWDLE